ncbi:hypothetical protein BH10PSE9_BH10PSE9_20430 [soil metagenome]
MRGPFVTLRWWKAIAEGAHGVIAVSVLEWAGIGSPSLTIDWTPIRDAASAERFAAQIEALPYRPADGTSIGSAIGIAHLLLDAAPYRTNRRVIDVSGDGVSVNPSHLADARASAIAAGITINGLPICETHPCDVQTHYAKQVIGGPGSFMVVVDGFASFDRAILNKLALEIAGLPRTGPDVALNNRHAAR